jgi:hypothetical protein
MTRVVKGFVALVKERNPSCGTSHCIIHRQQLATKIMPVGLTDVLEESIKMINFIKARPLKARLFAILCEDMGSEHTTLLLHTAVRRLSRGKVLVRLFE